MSLKGANIDNGSYVDADDIGEYDNALMCHTNRPDCCSVNRAGEWYFPNRSYVPVVGHYDHNLGYSDYFYRNRDDGVVRLNRHENPLAFGRFQCLVPDANGVTRTLIVQICK